MHLSKYYDKIPTKVQVDKDLFYRIVWVKGFDDPEQVGETDFSRKIVSIKLGMSKTESVKTYLHEMAHLYSDYYGAKFTESQVLNLENSFYFLLKKNNIFKE